MPSVSGQKAYEGLFDAKLTASNIEPLDALFADGEKGSAGSSGDAKAPLMLHQCAYIGCIPFV